MEGVGLIYFHILFAISMFVTRIPTFVWELLGCTRSRSIALRLEMDVIRFISFFVAHTYTNKGANHNITMITFAMSTMSTTRMTY